MSCQKRDGDIDNFSHENQAAPPALSSGRKMRIGIKSYLLRCLESDLREHNAVPFADTIIIDAALVQVLK